MSIELESTDTSVRPRVGVMQVQHVAPTCPCGSDHVSDLGRCRELSRSSANEPITEPGRLYRCAECHLLFRAPALSVSATDALYESISGDDWQYGDHGNTAWNEALKRLRRRPPGSVLDVGSFDGQFLAQVPPGWTRSAIEPNPAAVARLREMGIDAIQGNLTEEVSERLRGQFDVVTMFDVFEHLHDPLLGLECAAACLRPGGVLWLSTGNSDHWTWQLLGPEHPYLAPLQHVVIGGEEFFGRWCRRRDWPTPDFKRIAHGRPSRLERFRTGARAVYFGARRRHGLWRGVVRATHAWPGTRNWMHGQRMPHIAALADHIFVEISR